MPDQKLNILISYVYMTDRLVGLLSKHKKDIRLLIDSGAFTAWKAGKRIKLGDYMNFIKTLPIKPWRYFTLDVIGDPKRTWDNYQKMLDEGLKPVPIFTRGDDFKMLDKYYETSDLVAIGGLVGTPHNKGYVKRMMREVGDRKVHWLGFTKMEYVQYYKPYSVDSSGYCHSVRYVPSTIIHRGNGYTKSLGRSQLACQLTLKHNGSSYIESSNAIDILYGTKSFIVVIGDPFYRPLIEAYYENNPNLLRRA